MKYFVTLPSGREHVIDIADDEKGRPKVTVDGEPLPADAVSQPGAEHGASSVRIGGRIVELWLESTPPKVGVIADGRRFFAQVESERMRIRASGKAAGATDEGVVVSPMPGRVVRVIVAEGASVEAGAPVVVVEAMKMENELVATRAGRVKKVHVAAGATVEGGAPLIEIE